MIPESDEVKYPCSWEEAITLLRDDPAHGKLIYDAYLTADLVDNCERFAMSNEFAELLNLIRHHLPEAKDLLDIPGGNGIATYAFATAGYNVTTVEPDPSETVGRGAIKAVMCAKGLQSDIISAYGEDLPFEDAKFDIVYVRQGLHHAQDLCKMLKEYFRVLRPGGLLCACREHVVDDYRESLEKFLSSQVDHQLYGGENAFMLKDYRAAIIEAGFIIQEELAPYDSPINLYPNTLESLKQKIQDTSAGKLLSIIVPRTMVEKIGMWYLKKSRLPGRLYSFIAIRSA